MGHMAQKSDEKSHSQCPTWNGLCSQAKLVSHHETNQDYSRVSFYTKCKYPILLEKAILTNSK